jgi:hypothetical protein
MDQIHPITLLREARETHTQAEIAELLNVDVNRAPLGGSGQRTPRISI